MGNAWGWGTVLLCGSLAIGGCSALLGDFAVDSQSGVDAGTVVGPGSVPGADGSAPATGAHLTVGSPTLDFGSTTVGQPVGGGAVKVTNTGTAATAPLSVVVAGSGFSTAGDTCTGGALSPGASCQIGVSVDASAPGKKSGTLTVTDSAADTVTVELKAEVLTQGALSIAPNAWDFAGVAVGVTSGQQMFTVTNTGASPTGSLAATLGGTNASELAMIDGCSGKPLPAGGTCTVKVTMTPTTAAPKTASLSVAATPGGTANASLSGKGLSPTSLSIQPIGFSFGTLAVGAPARSQLFTVTNDGDITSTAITTAVAPGAGTGSADFTMTTDGCAGKSLASKATCDVTVSFAPAAHGAKSASLNINGGSPSASLTGTGQDSVTLKVTKSGAGGGTVSDTTTAIACGVRCDATYPRTTVDPPVTLTATPDGTSSFVGWTGGGCAGTGQCVTTLSGTTTVDAQFKVLQKSLTVKFRSIGAQLPTLSSVPAVLGCAAAPCTAVAVVDVGTNVTLNLANLGPGALNGWSVPGCAGKTCAVVVNGDMVVNVTTTAGPNIVFMTSQGHSGDFGGVAGGDVICKQAAQAAGLPGSYVAFLGTGAPAATPYSRLGAARGWVRLDGLPFTDTVAGFAGTPTSADALIWYPADVSEYGNIVQGTAFIGVNPASTCADWTSTAGTVNSGQNTMNTGNYWLQGFGYSCAGPSSIACFGTDFTVPVSVNPAPGRGIFASTGFFTASSGRPAADALCQNEATTAGLVNPGKYLAALSTTTASAASRFDLAGAPWVRPDGVQVATTPTDFMNAILRAPIGVHADKKRALGAVWVGSNAGLSTKSASANESCNDWTSAAAGVNGSIGVPEAGSPQAFSWATPACNNTWNLICAEN